MKPGEVGLNKFVVDTNLCVRGQVYSITNKSTIDSVLKQLVVMQKYLQDKHLVTEEQLE